MPTVSVIIPSYNHEAYIRDCIQSVLDQTYQDFEIVITDDGSRDRSVEIIRSFNDPRIRLFVHDQNRGACVASNNCIRHSKGQYIAMLSSDDIWLPDKLERQVLYLELHPEIGAVFGKVEWIDAQGNTITDPNFPYHHVFDVENRDRFQWLHHFFFYGNSLCHPSSLVRRECYDKVGWLDPAFASIPDFDLWIRLCLQYEIHILDEKLIRFRRIGEESNASGATLKSILRNRFEYKLVLNHFLDLKDPEQFSRAFPEAIKYGTVTAGLIPYFLGRLAVETGVDYMTLWGLEVIYDLLENEQTAQELEAKCGFLYRDFIRLTGESNLYNHAVLQGYPAHVAYLTEQNQALNAQLQGLLSSKSWRLILKLQHLRHKLLPYGSSRAVVASRILRWLSGSQT